MSPAVSRALLAVQTCYFLHLSKKKKHTAGPTLHISPVVSTSVTTRGVPTLNHHLPPQQSHQEAALAVKLDGVRQQVTVGGESKLRKNSCCFCVCCSRVCAPTPVLVLLWPCHCSEAIWGRVLVLMVAVSWVMRHLKQCLSVVTCSRPPQSVPSELCISVWWILWHLDCLSCIMPGDLWCFVLCNYKWEEM